MGMCYSSSPSLSSSPVKNKNKSSKNQKKSTVIIPSIPSPENEEKNDEISSVMTPPHIPSDEEDCLSITRSRRVKICKRTDGSTSISESTSMSTSVSGSPQKYNMNNDNNDNEEKEDEPKKDKVIVPKKWFESLLGQIKNEEND